MRRPIHDRDGALGAMDMRIALDAAADAHRCFANGSHRLPMTLVQLHGDDPRHQSDLRITA
jgi:hypothetical protein